MRPCTIIPHGSVGLGDCLQRSTVGRGTGWTYWGFGFDGGTGVRRCSIVRRDIQFERLRVSPANLRPGGEVQKNMVSSGALRAGPNGSPTALALQ